MKDNLFEILLNLFEKSLTQLQKKQSATEQEALMIPNEDEIVLNFQDQSLYIKAYTDQSMRIFTYEEQMKLTKASYQFLMKMKLWDVINADHFEMVMNQLQFSESRIVTLEETKWAIRNTLETSLSEEQLAFLDLVLYHSEDELSVH